MHNIIVNYISKVSQGSKGNQASLPQQGQSITQHGFLEAYSEHIDILFHNIDI